MVVANACFLLLSSPLLAQKGKGQAGKVVGMLLPWQWGVVKGEAKCGKSASKANACKVSPPTILCDSLH